MPELQNVWGDNWNNQINKFLEVVLGWEQLGISNSDVLDPETGKLRGVDSIFAYKRNSIAPQQVVFVEAKTTGNFNNLSKSKIQDWLTIIFSKLENLGNSKDFKEQYQPEDDADYHLALVALWVRDENNFSKETLSNWLSQIHLGHRKTPYRICLISNEIINNWIAIHEEIDRLVRGREEEYKTITHFVPDYGSLPTCKNNVIPIETLVSKMMFCKAEKVQKLRGTENKENYYSAVIMFYIGEIHNFDDLLLAGLALKQFQLFQYDEITIYTIEDLVKIRSHVENFKRQFKDYSGEIKFARLVPKNQIPSWME